MKGAATNMEIPDEDAERSWEESNQQPLIPNPTTFFVWPFPFGLTQVAIRTIYGTDFSCNSHFNLRRIWMAFRVLMHFLDDLRNFSDLLFDKLYTV